MAKTIGRRTIYVIICLHLALHFVDGIPLHLTILGIFCHLVYLTNFSSSWPFISFTSWKFVLSCLVVLIDHFAFYDYFYERAKSHRNSFVAGRIWQDKKSLRKAIHNDIPGFFEIASFFAVFVWLVPFFLFLSLSANDNVLPTDIKVPLSPITPSERSRIPALDLPSSSPVYSSGSIFRKLFSTIPLPPLRRGKTSHRELDGLIAPPSPNVPKSPLASSSVFAHQQNQNRSHYQAEDSYFPSTGPYPGSPSRSSASVPRQLQKKKATLTTDSPRIGSSPSPLQLGATSSPKTRTLTEHPSPLRANRKLQILPSTSSVADSNSSSSADDDSLFGEVTPADFDLMGMAAQNGSLRGMGSPALGKVKLV